MKRYSCFFFILLFVSCLLNAQQTQPDDKTIYRSDDNKLYINKNQGIYLWISTSPDPASEKIRLTSDSSERYTNPMYLDTEGYNSVRSPSCVDTATLETVFPLKDIIFEVYADGLPPVTKAHYQSALLKNIGGKQYFGSDLKIRLTGSDETSGVKSIHYKVNEDAMALYNEEIVNLKEGENSVEFYSEDKVGNLEKMRKEIFYIDNTPPKTEYQLEGNRSDKYVSAGAVIKLVSSDNFSGLKAIYYRVNNGPFTRYSNPIPVSVFTNDETSVSFYAEDNLGNKEALKSIGGKQKSIHVEGSSAPAQDMLFEFYIDRDPPQVSVEVDTDFYKGKYSYISTRSQFRIIADDEKSGVEKVLYSVNSALAETLYKDPFAVSSEGLQSLKVKSIDYVGNSSPLLTKTYFCDAKPPVSKIIIGSPKFLSRDTLFVTSSTPFTISATDDNSGVARIEYVKDKTEPVLYSSPFRFESAGINTVSYTATDHVNNKEVVNIQTLFIDNLPPSIIHNFSVEAIGTKQVRDEAYTIYPTNAMLYIASTDASSGAERIEYRINNGPVLTENPVRGFVPGNYIIQVNAFDVLGNKSSQEIKFAIEK